jgi:hypothetical protein
VRVYHFLNRHFGLENLRRQRLKIATINDLNDPFELLGPAPTDPNGRQRFRIWKDGMSARYGMLCFSGGWHNPVQWSHYAESHRGICLGFDVPDPALIKVKYRTSRLKPNIAALESSDEGTSAQEMRRILSTKYQHWQYENEHRCFLRLQDRDPSTGLFFASWWTGQLALKEVFVGHHSTVTRKELDLALGNMAGEVVAKKVRLAFQNYSVVEQRDQNLWRAG